MYFKILIFAGEANTRNFIRPWLFGEIADCSIEADDCRTSLS